MEAKFSTRSFWLALAAVFVLVAGGCGDDGGGDGGSGADGGEELTEDEFLDEFDNICTDANEDIAAIAQDFSDLDGLADAYAEARELAGDALADFDELRPPEDLDNDFEDALDAVEEGLAVLDDLIAAAEDEDLDEIDRLRDDYTETVDDLAAAAEDLGAECFEAADLSDDLSSDFSDSSSDFSSDISSDFSSDLSDDLGSPAPPEQFIPDYRTAIENEAYDDLADFCFDGDLVACDDLYQTSPVDPSINSYEGFGATCGGRLDTEEQAGSCVT